MDVYVCCVDHNPSLRGHVCYKEIDAPSQQNNSDGDVLAMKSSKYTQYRFYALAFGHLQAHSRWQNRIKSNRSAFDLRGVIYNIETRTDYILLYYNLLSFAIPPELSFKRAQLRVPGSTEMPSKFIISSLLEHGLPNTEVLWTLDRR